MKKLLLTAAVAVFGLTSINAQEITFGAKAGVNFSTIGGDETGDVESKTGFHIGAVAEIMISDKFSVQPELLYSAQGSKEVYTEDFGGIDVKVEDKAKLDYINLPIMAKYYVTDGLSIEAGPQIGFLISSKLESEYTLDGETESNEIDIKEFTSGLDLGLGIGLGYKVDSGLNFSARYNLGLSNVNDFSGSDLKNQNNVFQLSVGYMF